MKKYKAVFFDFDGTVMDTIRGCLDCYKDSVKEAGLDLPMIAENPKDLIGPPLKECFVIGFGITDDVLLEKLYPLYRTLYARYGYKRSEPYEHFTDAVKELRNRGYLLGITSLKNINLLKKTTDFFGISEYFDVINGIDNAETFTKADLIRQNVQTLGLSMSDVILVGDSKYDLAGAVEAGCDFLGVKWGYGSFPSDVKTIETPMELLDFFEE